MPDLQPGSNPESLNDVQLALEPDCPVARIFSPADLDLDDLAEAIRFLLGPPSTPQISPTGHPNPDLLSSPHRATHVLEANETR
jgi:hypothetical protein